MIDLGERHKESLKNLEANAGALDELCVFYISESRFCDRRSGRRETSRQVEKPTTTQVVRDKLRVEPQCDKRCGRRA